MGMPGADARVHETPDLLVAVPDAIKAQPVVVGGFAPDLNTVRYGGTQASKILVLAHATYQCTQLASGLKVTPT